MIKYPTSFRKEQLLFYLLLYSLLHSYRSVAQSNSPDLLRQFYKTISFGEKIDFGNIDESVTWTVSNSQNNIYATLRGKEINNYTFEKTGDYDINFQENKKHDESCHHPSFQERFKVKVTPVKMSFNFSKINFSEKILRGRNYSDLIISVPVKISSKDNSIKLIPSPELTIAGLGVSLTAEPLDQQIVMGSEIQILKYRVSGVVNQETYLMFDFYDFNNQVQTYNLPQLIK
ncbi:hypothetical protein [Flavobacterium sp. H4147]|uniref:hypothetical protein n=1 Tax=Flavobacterium sp. H4147 TaxID=3034149 RepID=UPI0023EC4264|nr:hypothetical protein [Flavobacterium sp. H4147]